MLAHQVGKTLQSGALLDDEVRRFVQQFRDSLAYVEGVPALGAAERPVADLALVTRIRGEGERAFGLTGGAAQEVQELIAHRVRLSLWRAL